MRKLLDRWKAARKRADAARTDEIFAWNAFIRACNDASPDELDAAGLPAAPRSIRQLSSHEIEGL